ncbi:MAG: hypothetical protein ACOX7W_06250 [Christensenellales bacterium]|jgi:hypothetical protein
MLHLGRNVTISEKHIVAILGMPSAHPPQWARAIASLSAGDPPFKSIILIDDGRQCRLVYSPVSPATLRGRIGQLPALQSARNDRNDTQERKTHARHKTTR